MELEKTIRDRKAQAPEGSYTHRLFNDPDLLGSKLMEEAEELCQAKNPEEVAWEAADLIYFALVKCASFGITLADIQNNLEKKSLKVTRRTGDAKPKWVAKKTSQVDPPSIPEIFKTRSNPAPPSFQIQTHVLSEISENERCGLIKRPILQYKEISGRVEPILREVRQRGDAALVEFTSKFDGVDLDEVVLVAPFPEECMKLSDNTRYAIDAAYDNIYKFHLAQAEAESTLEVETCPGVVCTRFSRPIQRVGLYIPGGTAVLPSTALMLGIPAKVAGCEKIIFATPPGPGGKIAPEVVYVAHKVGATHIVKAGGGRPLLLLPTALRPSPKWTRYADQETSTSRVPRCWCRTTVRPWWPSTCQLDPAKSLSSPTPLRNLRLSHRICFHRLNMAPIRSRFLSRWGSRTTRSETSYRKLRRRPSYFPAKTLSRSHLHIVSICRSLPLRRHLLFRTTMPPST